MMHKTFISGSRATVSERTNEPINCFAPLSIDGQHSSELPEHHEAGLAIGGSAGVVEGVVPAAGDAARHGRLPRQGEMKLMYCL